MVKVQSNKGLAKRIVPCLDVKNGETVKGTNFVNLRSAGDPVELGKAYSDAGADELVFLDITASFEERKTFTDMVTRVAAEINIPFTVGGGINELKDVDRLLNAGADKVSINSAAIRHPELINEIANHYGSQVCVCAIDARLDPDGWHCYVKGGRERVELGLFDWAREVADRGAGEILFTSMDHDGVKQGFANEALARLAEEVSIPIIASGGAGKMEHFRDAFTQGKADASDVCMVSLVCMAYSFLQRKKDAPYRKHPSLYNFSLSSLKYLFLIFPAIPYYRNNTTSIIGTIHKADCYISSLCLFFSRDYSITHFFTMFKSELK